jgi:TRAP-type C4-dicarboxylate transport system permease small subunit
MHTINHWVHRTLTVLSIFVFVLLIVDVVLGVSSRYLFGGQIRWTEELATFLLVWLVFCGAAIAYHDHAHLGIELLIQSLDPGARKIALAATHLIVLAFALGVMVYGGGMLTLERLDSGQMMSTLGIAKAWLYCSVPINGLFIVLFNIKILCDTLAAPTTAEGNGSVQS